MQRIFREVVVRGGATWYGPIQPGHGCWKQTYYEGGHVRHHVMCVHAPLTASHANNQCTRETTNVGQGSVRSWLHQSADIRHRFLPETFVLVLGSCWVDTSRQGVTNSPQSGRWFQQLEKKRPDTIETFRLRTRGTVKNVATMGMAC